MNYGWTSPDGFGGEASLKITDKEIRAMAKAIKKDLPDGGRGKEAD